MLISLKLGSLPSEPRAIVPAKTGLSVRLVNGSTVPTASKLTAMSALSWSNSPRTELSADPPNLTSSYPTLFLISPKACLMTLNASPLLSEIA